VFYIEAQAFSVGFRIEHEQSAIEQSTFFGPTLQRKFLAAAEL